MVHDWAVGVDRDAKTVTLAGGAVLPYDRLILSPGIDFVDGSVPGWDVSAQNKMPHAYKAGSQSELLKAQIEAMPQGGRFAMVAPPNPYRCPPGPYERIWMVAHLLTQVNPTAKILLVDPEGQVLQAGPVRGRLGKALPRHDRADRSGFRRRQGRGARRCDGSRDRRHGREGRCLQRDPGQKAGRICEMAGITEGNWAPVTGHTMQSRVDDNIYVLGDATNQGDMPKSGYSANSQAKVAAMAIRGELTGVVGVPGQVLEHLLVADRAG